MNYEPALVEAAGDDPLGPFQVRGEVLQDDLGGFLMEFEVVVVPIEVDETFHRLLRGVGGGNVLGVEIMGFVRTGLLSMPGDEQRHPRVTDGSLGNGLGDSHHVDAGIRDADHHHPIDLPILQPRLDGCAIFLGSGIGQQVDRVVQLTRDPQFFSDGRESLLGRQSESSAHLFQGVDSHPRRGHGVGDDQQTLAFGASLFGCGLDHIKQIHHVIDAQPPGPFEDRIIDHVFLGQIAGMGDREQGKDIALPRFDHDNGFAFGETSNGGHETATVVD